MASKEKKYIIDNDKLMSEWHWKRNNELGLNPERLKFKSHVKAWWVCEKGHEWEAVISSRHKNGCPYCSGKNVLTGVNDLQTMFPNIAKEWHPTKNNNLKPDVVSVQSNKRVWWKCKEGHEWKAAIHNRTRNNGTNCPYCSGRKVITGINDLTTINPELAEEWHPTKNGTLTPNDVMAHSGKMVWWLGKCGHEWEATVNKRSNKRGCPYCAGRKVLIGFNDLASTNPDLILEWNFEKNDVSPHEITAGSRKKVWWKCKKGHEWKAAINHRNKGTNCPICCNERFTSFPEQTILFYCKKITHAENRYTKLGKEIDIYLPEYKVGIEYNGSYWHKDKQQYDEDKVKYFADKGIRIITVKDSERNFVKGDVIEHIHNNTDKSSLGFVVKTIFNLIGIEFEEPNVNEDIIKIWEQYVEIEKENSIAVKNKKSITEWNYEKNGELLPTMISYGSNKKVWWKCSKCSHEWQARVSNYAKGSGCPKCAAMHTGEKNGTSIRCVETNVIYNSIAEASRITYIENIQKALSDNSKTAGGYHWEYVDKPKLSNRSKPVRCIETGFIYTSMTKAGKEIGVHHSKISLACNGKRKTAGGYHWEFVK